MLFTEDFSEKIIDFLKGKWYNIFGSVNKETLSSGKFSRGEYYITGKLCALQIGIYRYFVIFHKIIK